MGRLAKFRGHFYIWYDTVDLRPLDPLYVSAVDSGNLAGHLIALANSAEEWGATTARSLNDGQGIADALAIAAEEFQALRLSSSTSTITWRRLDSEFTRMAEALAR